jgi:hypothetical protein
MSGYLVSSIYRAHSSGWGERIEKIFTSLEKASQYMKECYNDYLLDCNYPEEWEQSDMFTDENMKTPHPPPTKEMGDILFSTDSVSKFLEDTKRYHDIIYGPWSDFECQVPFEITIKKISID